MLLPFDNPDSADSPDMVDAVPAPVLPAAPVPDGQIIWTCVFTFPPPAPGQAAGVNDNQVVETVVLDSSGAPVIVLGAPQPATSDGVYPLGGNQYGCAYACPPGFSGSAQATLTTGPNAGQTCASAINLGAATDLSDIAWTAGPPLTNVFDLSSRFLRANSDGYIHVLVTGVSQQTGEAADPLGVPPWAAATPASPAPPDFQPGDWLTIESGPAAGNYARLKLSVLVGNALAAGAYRVTVQLAGTTLIRAGGVLIVL